MKKSVKQMNSGNCRKLYQSPGPCAVVSYIFDQPRTSARKKHVVRTAMPGKEASDCLISRETWFLRYLGCWKVVLSKTK